MDRLSVQDNSFLDLERGPSHTHVGGVLVFDGPPVEQDELLAHVGGRLDLVPRYRQKIARPPLGTGRPYWVDDADFTLDYHVRRTALPRPGGVEELRRLCGRIFSQRLDRSKPLWEVWLAEGLEDDRFALISKTHHAMIDGVAGVDIASVLFDASPERQAPPAPHDWTPDPLPSSLGMLTGSARELAGAPLALASRAAAAVGAPRAVLRNVSEGARGVTELLGPGLVSAAPDTPLNVPIGSHRLTHWVTFPLGDLKAIKNALGGTLNDVVVAVVTGALRRVLQERGVDTAGLELRAMVPVSVRTESEGHQPGNRVAAMRAPLPVHIEDPVDRLREVSEAMSGLKESKQAHGAETLMGIQEFAPPTLLAVASRINFSTRLFNVIVTNIPGPQFPLYLLGRQLREFVPMVFLPQNHALAFAILSYNGRISFGLLADREAMPEVEFVAAELERSVSELLERAGDAPA